MSTSTWCVRERDLVEKEKERERETYQLAALVVRHCKTVSNFNFCSVVTANTQHCADDSFLACVPSQGMVEDGEQNDGLNGDHEGGLGCCGCVCCGKSACC